MPRLARIIQGLLFIIIMAGAASVAQAGSRFVDNQDGTISDPEHAIMWQKADDGVERSWKEAIQYCEGLELAGHADWTLPKAYQLEGLIDTAYSPTIDPLFSVKASYYWSATDSTNSQNSAKYVNFFYGNAYTYSKDNPYYALCVREAAVVSGKGLTAVFTGVPAAGKPLTVQFTTTVTGGSEPYFYEWDFGDGGTSSATGPSHEFTKEGPYKVLLTVSDDDGAVVVATQQISLPLAVVPDSGQEQSSAGKPAPAPSEGTVPVPTEAAGKAAPPAPEMKPDDRAAAPPAENDKGRQPGEGGTPKIQLVTPGAASQRGVLEVAASGQGGPYKDGALGHGLLAYTFANAMAGDGDWNKDGTVTASEIQAYLDQAIKSLSKGQQSPVAVRDGEDFPVCAASGSNTYVLAIGIPRDLAGAALVAGQDAELVRKAVEDKCPMTKSMMLTADHANRLDILQAVLQIGSMITAKDTLVVYVGAASGQDNGRLNWYVNDSRKDLPAFTGIFHDDLVQLLKTLPTGNLMVLGEKN